EMGETELRLIHGHGRRRGISPGFVNTNTGFLGLQIRRALRHDGELRKWIKHTTLDCHDRGCTTVKLKPNSAPVRSDYSLHHIKPRPAEVGDKLTTTNFNTGTRGFAAPEDSTTAVCILPGTELAFSEEVKCIPFRLSWKAKTINFSTAIFRQINKDVPRVH